MIKVMYENGNFLAKGTFSAGIVGVFENEDFGDEEIIIEDTLEEILEGLKNNDSLYKPLFPYIKDKGENGVAIAKGLEEYYNQKEKEIKENEKQINNCILCQVFDCPKSCEEVLWEIDELRMPGTMEDSDQDNLEEELYHTEESWWEDFWLGKPNNGTIQKVDVEGKLREMFPMFNFDALYQAIIPTGIQFHGRFITLEFSDDLDGCEGDAGWLFESVYAEFDENFALFDWHNH